MLGSRLCSEHAEYPRSTADVENYLTTKQVLVVVYGITIGQSSHLVLQHLFVNA